MGKNSRGGGGLVLSLDQVKTGIFLLLLTVVPKFIKNQTPKLIFIIRANFCRGRGSLSILH